MPKKKVPQTALFKNIPGQIFLWKEHISIVHEILFHMLQNKRTRLLPITQQITLNLPLRLKNFFAQIYAKKESAANSYFNNIPGQIFLWKKDISIGHEILFNLLQKNRTRLLPIIQQTTLNSDSSGSKSIRLIDSDITALVHARRLPICVNSESPHHEAWSRETLLTDTRNQLSCEKNHRKSTRGRKA